MKNRINALLCFFGFHNWETFKKKGTKAYKNMTEVNLTCKICNRKKSWVEFNDYEYLPDYPFYRKSHEA